MTDATAAPEPSAKNGLMDDLIGVLYAPVQVFAGRASGKFGAAFAIVSIAMAAVLIISRPMTQPVLDRQMAQARAQMMAQNPQMTEEQAQTGAAVGAVIAKVVTVLGPPITILFLGLFVWLVGKLFGAGLTVGQGMMIATFAFVPRILGALAALMLSFVHTPPNLSNLAQLTVGPGRFVDPASTSAAVIAALGRLDIFLVWGTIVIAAGYLALGNLPKRRAYLAAGLLWLLASAPILAGAMRGG